jgi:hypothetical protein
VTARWTWSPGTAHTLVDAVTTLRDRTFTDEHWGEALGREQRPLAPAQLQLLAIEIRVQLS